MANGARIDVFLLLPRILLEGGAFTNGFSVRGLDLAAVKHLVERVLAEGGGELSNYVANRGKAFLVQDNIRTTLR